MKKMLAVMFLIAVTTTDVRAQCAGGSCSAGSSSMMMVAPAGYQIGQQAVYGPLGRFRGFRTILVPSAGTATQPATTPPADSSPTLADIMMAVQNLNSDVTIIRADIAGIKSRLTALEAKTGIKP